MWRFVLQTPLVLDAGIVPQLGHQIARFSPVRSTPREMTGISQSIRRASEDSLLGRVGRSPAGSPLRRNALVGSTALPVIGTYNRCVGRPRQDWASQAIAEAERRAGSHSRLARALLDTSPGAAQRWKSMFVSIGRKQ